MDITTLIEQAGKTETGTLNEAVSKQLLKEYDIPVINETIAETEELAVRAAEKTGYPIVLKALGATLTHKTEKGLVRLDINNNQDVINTAKSFKSICGDKLEGFLIQPRISGKREFVAGMFKDSLFGPVIMFGLGGIFTEALSDVSFRLAPLDEADAEEMIDEIKAKKLLGSFRGEKAVDRNLLVKTLVGLSKIAIEYPQIEEIDINPLVADTKGDVIAVDALVVAGKKPDEANYIPPVDPSLLGNFFHPRSIVFVGASAQFGKWGHNLMCITVSRGFKGDIFLVNPKGGTIAGRTVYESVDKIPGSVDMAVVTIPAAGVMNLLPAFSAKGIKNVLLITSGFAETGDDGRQMEKELVQKARAEGILILGPNTMGICNPHISLYCTGSNVWPKAGGTTVIAQSGNMGTQLLAFAEEQDIGVRMFAGSGNEGMITIEDFLEGAAYDVKTKIIMLYLESVKNGPRFFKAAQKVGKTKPVILLKGGQSSAGNRAAQSHTGAMTSDAGVFNAVCRQAGVVKVEHPMDLLDLTSAFSSLPLPRGNRAAIMTFGGGWGVVAADLCSEYGLYVPELSEELTGLMDNLLPPYWSRSNPVDLVGEFDNDLTMTITEELLKWDGCDAVIILGIMGRSILLNRMLSSTKKTDSAYTTDFLDSVQATLDKFEEDYVVSLIKLMETYEKPVFGVHLLTEGDKTVYSGNDSRFNAVFYKTPERAIKAFSKMYEYNRYLTRK
ncbi:acetate--CoA ligase family protein [Desulfobacterales bacterium HSG16]|nr:acetate--CoA ligase family protein [Desulfobacterales bacterium HSG16]